MKTVIFLLILLLGLQMLQIGELKSRLLEQDEHYFRLLLEEGVKCKVLNVKCEERK